MRQSVAVEKLKGGSLSGTYLYRDGNNSFVRKEVSLIQNREFGFYRWFSQLKKLQSLGRLFPGLFPKVLNIDTKGDNAFFDLEFIANSVNGFEYLKSNPQQKDIDIFFRKLMAAMERIHSVKIPSFKGGINLYINQEVRRAIEFCQDEPSFNLFLKHKTIIFNGRETPPLLPNLEKFHTLARRIYTNPEECLTHGNMTLENILYVPESQRVIFIDLYQENFIDSVYNEYSQILQSSNSYYEVYNSQNAHAVINGNSVYISSERFPGIDYFNQHFDEFLKNRLSPNEYVLTKLYEVSQFTRLLPFKKVVAKDKMIFFYSLASQLFYSIAG